MKTYNNVKGPRGRAIDGYAAQDMNAELHSMNSDSTSFISSSECDQTYMLQQNGYSPTMARVMASRIGVLINQFEGRGRLESHHGLRYNNRSH